MTTSDSVQVEPTVDPHDIDLPSRLGDQIAAFYDTETVETAGDWLDALDEGLEPSDERAISVDDLCTTDESPHVLETDDDTQAYQCVIDPMIVPFLTDDPATVRSACPVTGDDIVFEITAGEVTARPEGAFFSLGIAPEASGTPPYASEEVYGSFCPYGNVFASKEAYEQWAGETDALTTRLPLEYGVAVVGAIARRIGAENSDD